MIFRPVARRVLLHLRAALAAGTRPALLMYHRIARESFDPWGLAVTPERFVRQLEWLVRNRSVLSLEDFAQRHFDGTLPDAAVALTFDDGYACALETAGPELDRLSLSATVFLPAELIERGQEFWWDDLQRIVIGCPDDVLVLNGERFPLGAADAADQHWPPGQSPRTSRQRAYLRLWKRLHGRPDQDIAVAINDLRGQAKQASKPRSSHRPLSREHFEGFRPAGLSFGAHGLSHASLPTLSGLDLELEIGESAARCADLSGKMPRAFAYPFGDHDPNIERLVERAGYLCACTSRRAAIDKRSTMFALPRLAIGDWEPAELRLRLASL